MAAEERTIEDLVRAYLFAHLSLADFSCQIRQAPRPDEEELFRRGAVELLQRYESGEASRSELDTGLIRVLQAWRAGRASQTED